MTTPDEILDFWFGSAADDAAVAEAKNHLWWSHDRRDDEALATRFGHVLERAARGELGDWSSTPHGRLALVIVLDQFSRSLYRQTPRAFAQDERARALAEEGIASGHDRALRPIERTFLYMPFMHSEDRADQRRSVELFAGLRDEVPAAQRGVFENFHDFARRHCEIVERFGRFPHRNSILERTSTEEEEAFLEEPGSSF